MVVAVVVVTQSHLQMPVVMAAEGSQLSPFLRLPSVEASYLTLGHTPLRGTAHIQGAKCNQVAVVTQSLMISCCVLW